MAPSKKAGKKAAIAKKANAKGGTKVAKADWKEGFKKKQVGVSDMTLLSTITNDSINENLSKRWKNGDIYTYIGSVLISVNPFKDLGIYTNEILHSYKGKNRLEASPHVFAIAESAYYNMQAYHENQCVIISGESGAGKTEAAKRIMQYIAAVSGGADSSIQQIKDMVLATNPLLESFGCAKTLRNNNSSRHGKYLEIMFNSSGDPIGAQITNYLLEKGRVVGQVERERNFHIFYQFTKAASSEQREMFGLQGPEGYSYTNRSNCLEVEGIDDRGDWAQTLNAMNVIGLDSEEQFAIFRMLAIILWLGNVQFVEQEDGSAGISDTGVSDFVAYLMEVESSLVEKVLTSRIVETQRGGRRGSVYDVPLNPAQAMAGRDALSKAIYNNLFEWIVARVNISMKPKTEYAQLIGVLDIYGFEIFQHNSFEQLCINYVNEKLQQIFIELTLKTEQEEYIREKIKWTPIDYFNNKVVCDLIEERRPPGIFASLNDATATAHADPAAADNSFVQRLSALSSNAHFEPRGAQFVVKHYAGDVMYDAVGMTDKNKDALIKDILDLVASSSNIFLQGLFPDRPDPNSKKRPPTASDKIKTSAGALVENLMRAQPSYIRTIKPNQNRSPTEYDDKAILHQIKYLGLQENIRVRRAGFAYRNTFEKMIERFYLLSSATSYAGDYIWQGDAQSGCEKILVDVGISKGEWQMGTTKAFIKNPETLFALETMRDRYWHNMAARIQRAWRNYVRHKVECAIRIQRFWRRNKQGLEFAKVRDYGHQVLAGRKERRRFSLSGYRRFFGDYLEVSAGSALGDTLRVASNVGGEPVAFSSRAQLLVSKLGRSSKPSPRFLVVTAKAVYIIISSEKDGAAITSLERKIPLITIKSISMSNLRDDWLSLNCNASEEGDPVIHCYFKTELAATLCRLTQASISVIIGPNIEYAKKKDKKTKIAFQKDESVLKDDVYKSHTVRVPSGEPATSLSRLIPRPKPRIIKQPSNKYAKKASSSAVRPSVKPSSKPGAQAQRIQKPRDAVSAPPPPPPRPPHTTKASTNPLYRAKFAFEGQEGEMSMQKDDVVELLRKDDDGGAGWWLVRKDGVEGWAPYNYLELVVSDTQKPPPPPPPPTASVPPKVNLSTKSSSTVNVPKVAPSSSIHNKTPSLQQNPPNGDIRSPKPLINNTVKSKPPPPPAVGSKPSASKVGPKPPVPSTQRPASSSPAPGKAAAPRAVGGQMDLAAVLARRAQQAGNQ